MIRFLFVMIMASAVAGAQETGSPAPPANAAKSPVESIRERMVPSLARQKESVRKQVGTAQEAEGEFFTVPWPQDWVAPAAIGSPTPFRAIEDPKPAPKPSSAACRPIAPPSIDTYIRNASQREGLTPDLLRAVIRQESGYAPCAVSSKGALGLMQLMPSTAAWLGVDNPFDPEQNIAGGARFLGQLLDRYNGDMELALGAYNAGPARVDYYRGLPPIPETINYVSAILSSLREASPAETH